MLIQHSSFSLYHSLDLKERSLLISLSYYEPWTLCYCYWILKSCLSLTALCSPICFLFCVGLLGGACVYILLTISHVLSIYRVNVYIKYLKCICVSHAQQCLIITRNYKELTFLSVIFMFYHYFACT